MSFAFAAARPRRRPSLTPMIDVVFLLLVFFMLAARFGQDGAIGITAAGGNAPYSGPPRLVGIEAGSLTLNGVELALDALPAALSELTGAPADTIVLRAGPSADLQALTEVLSVLSAAGFTSLVLAE